VSWLIYRQHRQQALFGAATLALLALFLGLTGLHMYTIFRDSGLAHCLTVHQHGDCSDIESSFESRFSTLRQLVPFLMVLPLLLGLFWGAPLVARELEHDTHQMIWTQGVTRLRWFSAKVAALGGLTLALTAAYALLISWWLAPLNRSTGDRFQPGIFDQQGAVPIAYAFFALALGIAAGSIVRKTMSAMAVTLVGFVALRLVIAGIIRRHFLASVSTTFVPLPGIDTSHPGAWIFRQQMTEAGHTVAPFTIGSVCPATQTSATATLDRCVRAHAFLEHDVFQPASRYWLFQGIESAVYITLALALIAFTVWWIKKRIA
jgi:ABC-type transport system involved in multi-copper enzyme maturation permease subunit